MSGAIPPKLSASLVRYSGIVVGDNNQENLDNIVLEIFGSTLSYGNIQGKSFSTFGNIFIEGSTITGLDLPLNDPDAANKEYVDLVATGLNIKTPVYVATTINITLAGLQTIDGVILSIGDRVLVKDQLNQVENGIYNVQLLNWTRSSDFPAGSSAYRTTVSVENGTIQKGSIWVCTTKPPSDIVGTNPIEFILFSTTLVAGLGLYQTLNTLNVGVDNSSIEIDTNNQLKIKQVKNSDLQFSSITVNASNGISGIPSVVNLGSSVALTCDSTVVRTFGAQIISGNKVFNNPIILNNGTNGVSLFVSGALTTSYDFILPDSPGIPNQVLATDGTGTTFWSSSGGGGGSGDVNGPASSTDNAIAVYSGTSGKIIKNSVLITSPSGNLSGVNVLNTASLFINSESIAGQRLFYSLNNTSSSVTSAPQVLNLTSIISDSGYINAVGNVTIVSTGTYSLSYSMSYESINYIGSEYSTITSLLYLNIGLGNNPIVGSLVNCLMKKFNGDFLKNSVSKEIIINITVPNTIISLNYYRSSGTSNFQTVLNECSFGIKRLRP